MNDDSNYLHGDMRPPTVLRPCNMVALDALLQPTLLTQPIAPGFHGSHRGPLRAITPGHNCLWQIWLVYGNTLKQGQCQGVIVCVHYNTVQQGHMIGKAERHLNDRYIHFSAIGHV